jgi:cell division protein FtsZ
MEMFIQRAKEHEVVKFKGNEVGHANIKVVGSGGSGNNIVSWMYKRGIKGADIIAMNTDSQHLDISEADHKLLLGKDLTRGLGCGGFPQKGADAAMESMSEIKGLLKNTDMVFVCGGMGGGTGTGSLPVIAQVARDAGAIVVGVVTMPFDIERARLERAGWGLQRLQKVADTVITIDNNRLVKVAGNLPISQAFAVANELITTMVKGIVETISVPSLVNLDFADVHAIMKHGGVAAIGVGTSDTGNKVEEAVKQAMDNPLLDINYNGASGALIHICGGPEMTLEEISRAGEMVTEHLDQDANVIWGARVSEEMRGKLMIMTIVTGVTTPFDFGTPERKSRSEQKMAEELGIQLITD